MEAENNKPEAAGTEAVVMEGTKEMGYWEFKKQICDDKGWQLRRTDAQTYVVIDNQHAKLGIFKSGEGYLPDPVAVTDAEAPPESA
jgi:hypothetical protein